MENGTGQKPRRRSAQRLEARRTMGGMLLAMTPLWALFPSLGLLLMVLSPSFTGWLLAGAEADAPALLAAARRWYIVFLAALAAAWVLAAWLTSLAWRSLGRRGLLAVLGGHLAVMALVCVGGELLIFGLLVHMEELPQRIAWVDEDLRSIETDQLEVVECFISPKAHSVPIPGPYSGGMPEPLTVYGVIGEDTGRQWVRIYVPDGLGFALDPERLYDEDQSVPWNEANAQRYLIRYTSNLRIAAEVVPCSPGAADFAPGS